MPAKSVHSVFKKSCSHGNVLGNTGCYHKRELSLWKYSLCKINGVGAGIFSDNKYIKLFLAPEPPRPAPHTPHSSNLWLSNECLNEHSVFSSHWVACTGSLLTGGYWLTLVKPLSSLSLAWTLFKKKKLLSFWVHTLFFPSSPFSFSPSLIESKAGLLANNEAMKESQGL